MKFDQALLRIGATIVKSSKNGEQIVLMLRVDPNKQGFWNETIEEFLLASEERTREGDRRVTWTTDVSKYFYAVPDAGVVRYLWRIVLGGNPKAAAEALGRAAQRAVVSSVEVVSQPLVGRQTYEHNPAKGKIKGAYEANDAAQLIAGVRT